MVIENPLPPLNEWLPVALVWWLGITAVLIIAGVAIGYIVSAVRNGPARAAEITGTALRAAFSDLMGTSPRRIFALARLALQESLRRRVLVVPIVFFIVLAFAAWFLDTDNRDVGTLYLNFVLTATTYLSILLALFLSVFSLPNDMKQRTIYTVVTKPVRASEMVLGRIVGFMLCGTVILAVMGVAGYVFVLRGVRHEHTIDPETLTAVTTPADENGGVVKTGFTSVENGHRHRVDVYEDGTVHTSMEFGHYHDVTNMGSEDEPQYVLSAPRGMFTARVPVYGTLTFKDRAGNPAEKGINVGNEWEYRSYIEGGTLAAAVWRFEGITEADFPNGLPLEMTIRVFRSYKGDINQGILGSLTVRRPSDENVHSSEIPFEAEEFYVQKLDINRTLTNPAGEKVDLFKEYVEDGAVELVMRCETPAQYFGMAQPDVYLRASDASFAVNFFKANVGIWLQMLLITSYGVMFSTFLNGPIAMLATMFTLICGMYRDDILKVVFQEIQGGGPVEALIRIVNQDNLIVELENGPMKFFALTVDTIMRPIFGAITGVVPDFSRLNLVTYVSDGYDVPGDGLLIRTLMAFSYVLPLLIAGYFFLKSREVGK